MLLTYLFVVGIELIFVGLYLGRIRRQQIRYNANGPRGIWHIDNRVCIIRCDFDGCVGAAGGGTADHQRYVKTLARHFAGNVCHLFQGWRDQPGEANHLCIMFTCGFEDLFARHHHAEIDDFVAITAQHDGNNVLADIVDITLNRGDNQLAFGGSTGACFFFFDERYQMGHRLLHNTGRLHHLR